MLHRLTTWAQSCWATARHRLARAAETGDRGSISGEWAAIAAVMIAGALVIGGLIIAFAKGIAENLQSP